MIPKTIEELEAIRTECRVLVNKRASASAAAAVIPIPGVDGCGHHDHDGIAPDH
ncbi:hypothetical protein SAMN05428981_11152 [Bacillus sp. OV194]|nr:hypothetical protein SAMN05428981_11152 [Bacillus sp. OV194]